MRAYLLEHDFRSFPTFVVFPGSFASHRHGSFINSTMDALSKTFPKFNIIAFDGFLSPKFLAASCRAVIWNSSEFAQDMYSRLSDLLSDLRVSPQNTGIIGFSGGGTIALHVLHEDSQKEQPLFLKGAFTASPPLDQGVALSRIDKKVEGISHRLKLTDYGMLLWQAHRILLAQGNLIPAFLEIYRDNPEEFRARTWNEFVYEDLRNVVSALGIDRHQESAVVQSYENLFVDYAVREAGYETDLKSVFRQHNDLAQKLTEIRTRTVLYFSLDDPFLSDAHKGKFSSEVHQLLAKAKSNSNIHVFDPLFGAHVGVFLDKVFPEVLAFAFSTGEL